MHYVGSKILIQQNTPVFNCWCQLTQFHLMAVKRLYFQFIIYFKDIIV